MPTYEYLCSECQNKFDVRATFAEKEKGLKPECPNCHSQKTIQVFGSFATFSRGGGTSSSSLPGCGPVCGPGTC
jgi:putative FmdB family regulatory protein